MKGLYVSHSNRAQDAVHQAQWKQEYTGQTKGEMNLNDYDSQIDGTNQQQTPILQNNFLLLNKDRHQALYYEAKER